MQGVLWSLFFTCTSYEKLIIADTHNFLFLNLQTQVYWHESCYPVMHNCVKTITNYYWQLSGITRINYLLLLQLPTPTAPYTTASIWSSWQSVLNVWFQFYKISSEFIEKMSERVSKCSRLQILNFKSGIMVPFPKIRDLVIKTSVNIPIKKTRKLPEVRE